MNGKVQYVHMVKKKKSNLWLLFIVCCFLILLDLRIAGWQWVYWWWYALKRETFITIYLQTISPIYLNEEI